MTIADGVGPRSTLTAATVEHFAIIGKTAGPGTINRAMIEPGAAYQFEDLAFPAATASPSQRAWIDPDVLL